MQVSVERCSTVQVKEEKKAGEWGRNNFILSFWLIRYLKLNSGALDWATFYCIQQYSLEKVMRKSWYSTQFFHDIFLNLFQNCPLTLSTWKESGYDVQLSPSLSISSAIPFVGLLVKEGDIGGYPTPQYRKKKWQIPKYRVENRLNTDTVYFNHIYNRLRILMVASI